jgi:ABC-type glycerol-3-phosphate transport system substrate-binding protein
MVKRLLCLFLAALILTAAAACAESGRDTGDTGFIDTTVAETEEPRPDIPKNDFGGETFMILYPDWGLYTDYFFADEQNGDQMNDAIYKRAITVEEFLGVSIEQYNPGGIVEIMPSMKASVMAGSDDYRLALTHCIQDLGNMMTSGYLYDWNTLSYIDMSQKYWNDTMNDSLSVNGRAYYAVSSFMIADPNAILFNKEMINEYTLPDPYESVRNGKWTIDTMAEMSRTVSQDLDGDGKYTVNDLYGLGCEADWMLNSFMYGCDQFMVKRDETGAYILDMYNEKMLDITEKLYSLFHSDNTTFLWPYDSPVEKTIMIGTGRALFNIIPINKSKDYRQSDVDFGVLPYPKYSEEQEKYLSNDWSGLMCIPATVQNPDMTGMVCELLAYESQTTTMPAYYDILLTGKFARDEETVEMFDIIYSNIVYDYGMNYCGFAPGFMPLFYMIPQMIGQQKSTDLASLYAKNETQAQKALDDLAEKMDLLE